MSVLSKIKNFFSKYSISDCRIGIALSGQTDSTALFHLLREIKDEFSLRLVVLHVNYHLRRNDSDEDQRFVENLCNTHNIELFLKDAYISNSLEENARIERYKFFEQMKNAHNIKFIATAHTANDQAETLIFRLIRKTGIKGAAGILKFREDGIIRPILDVTRQEILSYLTENKYSWREDKSNYDVKFSRNRIRHNIIPELEKINPSATLHLAEFCEFMQNTDIDNIKNKCFENGLILNENHCETIEKNRIKTGNTVLLPNNSSMIVLKNFLLFKRNDDKSFEIQEIIVNENFKKSFVGNLWEVTISDKMPSKGENFAIVSKSDYPLKIKKLSETDILKNDTKPAVSRMKKSGLSKFERDNAPGLFDKNGILLAAPYCSWKFDQSSDAVRWAKIENI